MTSIEINGRRIPALVSGRVVDNNWNGRDSKTITLKMSYAEAMELFVDDLNWAIVYTDGETTEVYDNSEYSLAGPVTDNRNGTVTVKMGKPTDAELLAIIIGG